MTRLNLNEFNEFEIEHQKLIEGYLNNYPNEICDYNFLNLFLWNRMLEAKWKVYRNRLMIYYGGIDCLLMPVGEWFSPLEMLKLSDDLIENGKSGKFLFISREYVRQNEEIKNHFEMEIDLADADYIHQSQKLSALSGKKLQKKKNLVNQFKNKFPDYKIHEINIDNFHHCKELSAIWARNKNENEFGIIEEMEAMAKIEKYFGTLDIKGILITVEDRLVAFSIYSKQTEDMATIHFEKFDLNFKGSAQIINYEIANSLVHEFKLINRDQDMGIEGLRRAKKSYAPDRQIITYILKRKL